MKVYFFPLLTVICNHLQNLILIFLIFFFFNFFFWILILFPYFHILVLGKGGQKIREMQEQSGAYIKVCKETLI